jgi:hypothetical protein
VALHSDLPYARAPFEGRLGTNVAAVLVPRAGCPLVLRILVVSGNPLSRVFTL